MRVYQTPRIVLDEHFISSSLSKLAEKIICTYWICAFNLSRPFQMKSTSQSLTYLREHYKMRRKGKEREIFLLWFFSFFFPTRWLGDPWVVLHFKKRLRRDFKKFVWYCKKKCIVNFSLTVYSLSSWKILHMMFRVAILCAN